MFEDVGPEPGLSRWAATALENQIPLVESCAFRNQTRCFPKLKLVVTRLRHRGRNTVCRSNKTGPLTVSELLQRFADALDAGLNEPRMVIEDAKFVALRRALS